MKLSFMSLAHVPKNWIPHRHVTIAMRSDGGLPAQNAAQRSAGNCTEAKIEVYAAWRKDDASPAVHGFLDCVRTIVPAHKHKPVSVGAPGKPALFPLDSCEQCAQARAVRTGR